MAIIDKPITGYRLLRQTKTAITRASRGQLIVQSWPRRRGRHGLTERQKDQIEWFKQAVLLAKYAPADEYFFRRLYADGKIRNPRDLSISAMAGRLFPTLLIDGVRYTSMSVKIDISVNLDLFTTTPGGLLVRGTQLWSGLSPGNEGDLLTMHSGDPCWLPSEEPPPTTPTPVPQPSYVTGLSTTQTQRCVGTIIKTHAEYTATRLLWIDAAGNAANARVAYLAEITEPSPNSTVVEIIATPGSLLPVAGEPTNYDLLLNPPVVFATGKWYALALAIQTAGAPAQAWIKYGARTSLRPFYPIENLEGRFACDVTELKINDVLTKVAGSIYAIWIY